MQSDEQLSLAERVQEAVLLSFSPLGVQEVTLRLYGEITESGISDVRRTLHELVQNGELSLVNDYGQERLAWTA